MLWPAPSSSHTKEEYRSLLPERQDLELSRKREYSPQEEVQSFEARGAKVQSRTRRKGASGTAVGRRRGGHSLGGGANLPGREAVTPERGISDLVSVHGSRSEETKREREREDRETTNRDQGLDRLGLFMRRQRRQDKDAADNVERAGEDRVSEFGGRGRGELFGEGREGEGEVVLEDVA